MWTALSRGGLGIVVLTFLMWVVRIILDPILSVATSGPHASAPTVQRISGYFAAMTLDNLVLLAGVGVAIHLLGRAATERRLPR